MNDLSDQTNRRNNAGRRESNSEAGEGHAYNQFWYGRGTKDQVAHPKRNPK
jgi:hypothetical protein